MWSSPDFALISHQLRIRYECLELLMLARSGVQVPPIAVAPILGRYASQGARNGAHFHHNQHTMGEQATCGWNAGEMQTQGACEGPSSTVKLRHVSLETRYPGHQ